MLLHRALAALHHQLDGNVARVVARQRDAFGLRVSCRKGCAACCSLQITAQLSDALGVLAYLERYAPDKTDTLVAPCAADAKLLADPDMTVDLYSRHVRVCPLLSDDRTCSVYPARPIMCRVHTSFDDPAKCSERGAVIRQLPAAEINERMLPVYDKLMRQAGMPNPSGPLPYMLLAGIWLTRNDGQWQRLANTSVFDPRLAAASWLHLERDMDPTAFANARAMITEALGHMPTVYPLWDDPSLAPPS